VAIGEKTQPDNWSTFHARSCLGGALLGRKNFAAAESLIVSGYEGMKARESRIPARSRDRLMESGERVAQLYDAWGKKDRAAEWRAKLAPASTAPATPK
jgi:hypothetical protein